MKKLVQLAPLAALTLLVSCAPSLGDLSQLGYVGGSAASQSAIQTQVNTAATTAYYSSLANPYAATWLTPGTPTASLASLAGQQYSIPFTNGVVDSASLAAGILVYPLTATASTDGSYTRGTAITPTSTQVLPNGLGGCTVILTLDLSGATVSSPLEVELAAGSLTANKGSSKLNHDANLVLGEAGADDYYFYPTVTGAPVAAVGAQRNPIATITISGGTGPTLGATTATTTVADSAGGTNIDTSSLAAGLSWSKFDSSAGSWNLQSAVNSSGSYAGGTLTYTFPAFANGEIWRLVIDKPTVKESQTVRGFIHQAGYDSANPANRYSYQYFGVGTTSSPFANVAAAGASVYGNIDLSAGHDWSVTNQSFSISLDGASPVVVTLNTNCTTLSGATTSAVVTELNTALKAATGFPTNTTAPSPTSSSIYAKVSPYDPNAIELTRGSNFSGSAKYFTITAAATNDALATLGLAAGSYAGVNAWTGSIAGIALSGSSGSYYLDVNFAPDAQGKAVDQSTVTPATLVMVDATTRLPVCTWSSANALWLSASHLRILLPSNVAATTGSSYRLWLQPTARSLGQIPYADVTRTDSSGVYVESAKF
ncbi:MAG TPA: hypothetical protein VMV83_14230 [Rectinemataceae bacterium]|nr:hypothetical protein [Rectinemataceae bacterium]